MNYALTSYPLSNDYRKRLESELGYAPTYLNVSELRRMPPLKMLKHLRTLKAENFYLPLEDANSNAILPVLRGLSILSDAKSIEIVHPDFRREKVSRAQFFSFVANVLNATLATRNAVGQCTSETSKLNAENRIPLKEPKNKSVLYVNANLWFGVKAGGSVGHIAGVVNGLVRKGYDVEYAGVSPCVMADSRVKNTILGIPKVFGFPMEGNYYRVHRDSVDQLKSKVTSTSYAFMYQRMSLANYTGVVLSRLSGIPLIMEYNGSEVWVAKNWGRPLKFQALGEAAELSCMKHSHLIVTISEVLRDELIERGVDPKRIVTYPNCIDPGIFDPARFTLEDRARIRAQWNIPQDALVGTFIGTFGNWHGVEVLAEAIKTMVDRDAEWLRANKVVFLLIGDGINMPKVKALLGDEKYQEFHRLTGLIPQAQAPIHLFSSDFLLSPHVPNSDGSRFFGSPTKLFEYMAMDKGIVASELDQIGDVLSPGIRVTELPSTPPTSESDPVAVLCKPGDVEELITGIKFVVSNPEWNSCLGKNARHKALNQYTWDHHVQAILEGLERVTKEEKP